MTAAKARARYVLMPADHLDTLPARSKRDFNLGGVYALGEKQDDGRWRLFSRRDVPSVALGRCPSAAYEEFLPTVTAQPAVTAEAPVTAEATPVAGRGHVAAMRRIAAATSGSS